MLHKMIQLSDNQLIVAIQGINDALKYNQRLLESETLLNSADQEEYVYTLSELASYMKSEYTRRLAENSALPTYTQLVPDEPGDPTD